MYLQKFYMVKLKSINKALKVMSRMQRWWSKKINILKKIISLQCSWVKRLYDDSFIEWKISLRLIKNVFGNSFRFHANVDFKRHHVKSFSNYYRDILFNWKKYSSQKPEVPSY